MGIRIKYKFKGYDFVQNDIIREIEDDDDDFEELIQKR